MNEDKFIFHTKSVSKEEAKQLFGEQQAIDARKKVLAEKLTKAREKVKAIAMVNTASMTMKEKRKIAVEYELAQSVMAIAEYDLNEYMKSSGT